MKTPFELKPANEFTQEEKNAFFDEMHKQMQEYIDCCNSDEYYADSDYEYYMYESVCEGLAPDFFDWFNDVLCGDDE